MIKKTLLAVAILFSVPAMGNDAFIEENEENEEIVPYETTMEEDTELNVEGYIGDQIAGPIWSNNHAKLICPGVCSSVGGSWTGHWHTVIPGRQSVCNCRFN